MMADTLKPGIGEATGVRKTAARSTVRAISRMLRAMRPSSIEGRLATSHFCQRSRRFLPKIAARYNRAGLQTAASRSDRTRQGSGGWGARIRTWEWRYQKPLPYRLATPQSALPSRARRSRAQQRSSCSGVGIDKRAAPDPGLRPEPCRKRSRNPCPWLLRCGERLAISRPPVDRSVAQPGRAPRSGRGGRRFKSCHSDQNFPRYRK